MVIVIETFSNHVTTSAVTCSINNIDFRSSYIIVYHIIFIIMIIIPEVTTCFLSFNE